MNPQASRRWALSLLLSGLSACTTTGSTSPNGSSGQSSVKKSHLAVNWYKGSVESALSEARTNHRPIFLYWGAVWCPPCNEVKSQVFSHPQFPDLISQAIPVYLDGDSDSAQMWADRLQVSGYPTLLLLDSKGKEIVRIVESVNFAEFKEVFESALAANSPLEEILTRTLAGKGSREDWHVLAYFNWDTTKKLQKSPLELIKARRKLVDTIPTDLVEERALLTARYLESLAAAGDTKGQKDLDKYLGEARMDAPAYLQKIFEKPEGVVSARAFINYSGKNAITWMYPDKDDSARSKQMDRWLEAARVIRNRSELSADTRLWTYQSEVDFFQMRNPTADLPASIVSEVKSLVAAGDKDSETTYERHAFISGAAEMLRMVGEVKAAKELLLKELQTTDTPWYYWSSLAVLAEKQGNIAEALEYSEKARTSAKGQATRLQWTTSDLLMNARIKSANQEQRLASILKEYYDTAFSLSDGFSGRNESRAERVARDLGKWSKRSGIKGVVTRYSKQCKDLSGISRDNCRKHFASLNGVNPSTATK